MAEASRKSRKPPTSDRRKGNREGTEPAHIVVVVTYRCGTIVDIPFPLVITRGDSGATVSSISPGELEDDRPNEE